MILGNEWVHQNLASRVSYLIHLHIHPRPWGQGLVYMGPITWFGCDTLPSVLGDTRQRVSLSDECLPSYHSTTRPPAGPFVSFFAECARRHSAKLASLPSFRAIALGKEALPVPRCSFFAECYDLDTRQNTSLPSVTLGKVTSIHLFNLFFLFPPKKQKYISYTSKISHNHHRYHIYITYLIKTIYQTSSHNITNMFEHKHKYPTLKNISLKYLTKHYQHQTSLYQVISQSINNTTKDNISSRWTAGLVRDGLGDPWGLLDAACDGTSQGIRPTYSCPCPKDLGQPCRCT